MEERMRMEDMAWSHYGYFSHQQELASGFTGRRRNCMMSTLSLSNASLTGLAVRVAGVEGVSGGAGSSAIV